MTKTLLAAASLAAASLMCLPAQAQSGGPGMPTVTPQAGTTNAMSMGETTTTSGPVAAGRQASTGTNDSANTDMRSQAQAPMRGTVGVRRGDAAERRMTECLNNAMAQRQPIGSCQR